MRCCKGSPREVGEDASLPAPGRYAWAKSNFAYVQGPLTGFLEGMKDKIAEEMQTFHGHKPGVKFH